MKEKVFRMGTILSLVLLMAFFHPASAAFDNQSDIIASAAVKMKLNETNISLHIGEIYQLKVIGTNKKVKWSSNNSKIVSVTQKGKVLAQKRGKATITAKINGKSLKCKVTVKKTAGDISSDKNNNSDSGKVDDGKSGSDNVDNNVDNDNAGNSNTGNNSQDANSHNAGHESDTAYDLLYQTIMEKGYLNSDFNHVIKENIEGNEFAILYDSKAEQFEFIGVVLNKNFVVKMNLGRKGSKSTSINCIFMPANIIGAFEAEASFNLEDYVLESNTLDFKVKGNSKFNDTECKEVSRTVSDLCMLGWKICIMKNSKYNLTMEELGFINL